MFTESDILDALVSAVTFNDEELKQVALKEYYDLRLGYRATDEGHALIRLTQNQWAKISSIDLERVTRHKWFAVPNIKGGASFYARAKINGKSVALGRFILGIESDDHLIADHINHDTLDNTRENLRSVTKLQSSQNRRGWHRKGSEDGVKFKGVYKAGSKWRAVIKNDGSAIHLGKFATAEEAALAYDSAAIIYHGEYASLNYGPECHSSTISNE